MASEVAAVHTVAGGAKGEMRAALSDSPGLSTVDRETEAPPGETGGLSWSSIPTINCEAEGTGEKSAPAPEENHSGSESRKEEKETSEDVKELDEKVTGSRAELSQEREGARKGLSQKPAGMELGSEVMGGLSWQSVGISESLNQESVELGDVLNQNLAGAEKGLSREPTKTGDPLSEEPESATDSLIQESEAATESLNKEFVKIGEDLIWETVGTREGPHWDCLIPEPLRLDKETAEGREQEQELRDSQSGRQQAAAETSIPMTNVNKTETEDINSAPAGSPGEGRIMQDITWPDQQVGDATFPDPSQAPIATCNTEAATPGDREQREGRSVSSAGGVQNNTGWEGLAPERVSLPESEEQAPVTITKQSCPGLASASASSQCQRPQERPETMALENGDHSDEATDLCPGNPSSETPIEREIRLNMEREELLRRERGIAPSLGSQQYVEVRMKPILDQSLPTVPMLPKEKDRQLAGVQMQRDILLESQREEDLMQLGKVRGLYDRGMPQELQEKRLLFEQKQDGLEPTALKRLSRGFSTETPPAKTPESTKGPSYAEANGANMIILEHGTVRQPSSSPMATKRLLTSDQAAQPRVADGELNPSFSPQGTVESIQCNPFFKLRSKSPQSLLEQEIREVTERENELRRLRHNLYGFQPLDTSDQEQHTSEEEQPMAKSSFAERLSFGKLDVTWPPRRAADDMNEKMPEQEERSTGSLRQKSALLQRWEAGMVSNHLPEGEE